MLSILIPTYNYNVVQLVQSLHHQCTDCQIDFEILVLDDCSTKTNVLEENKTISTLNNVQYLNNSVNLGNAQTRIKLASKALFNWLLFLDADTIPVHNNFIKKYLRFIQTKNANVLAGNILYKEEYEEKYRLKLLHGKKYEELNNQFNEEDFIGLRGANFLIDKKWFNKDYFLELPQNYGYVDTVFGIVLKQQGAIVKLVNNPVYHLGIEEANNFLLKTNKGIENAIFLEENHPTIATHLKIVRFYIKLKQLRLRSLFNSIFKLIQPLILKNLLGRKPSLYLFQLYKIGTYLQLKR